MGRGSKNLALITATGWHGGRAPGLGRQLPSRAFLVVLVSPLHPWPSLKPTWFSKVGGTPAGSVVPLRSLSMCVSVLPLCQGSSGLVAGTRLESRIRGKAQATHACAGTASFRSPATAPKRQPLPRLAQPHRPSQHSSSRNSGTRYRVPPGMQNSAAQAPHLR